MPEDKCFHCSLPIVEKKPPRLEVEAQSREFCCHGCKAVCEAIVSSGNADYYKHREGSARTFNSSELPELLDKIKLYDNEKIQREFIRTDKNNEWKEVWLILEEIRCAACMWLNERTLRSLDGVLDIQMDYTGQQTRVRWNPNKIKLSEILTAITNIGYNAHPFDPSQRESLNKEQKQRSVQRIIFALIMGMAVMQSAIGGYFFGDVNAQGEFPLWIKISRWVNVISTFLILAYPGQLFFRSAWRDLKNKSLGMDVPVVIGLSVAWLGSLFSTIRGTGDVYFESIAMFVVFLLIARHIELKSRIESTALLDRASKIIPQTAKLLVDKGGEEGVEEVPVIELVKGDRIQLAPGETLPVDGRLLSSNSSFDESLLTGESLPVMHSKGELVLGGSINIEQVIEVEVTSSKSNSTLNEIQQLAQRSTNYRPYYVDIAESVAGKFVAVILFIATATFLFWAWESGFSNLSTALTNTISVLIVTCPCALALAAPVALSLGAAGLNRLHLLAVKMSSIEKLSHVDTIIFDKTGTLTTGEPIVKEIQALGGLEVGEYAQIAAAMEQGSHHPFAKAIIQYQFELSENTKGQKRGGVCFKITNKQLKQVTGQGVETIFEGVTWRLGNENFIKSFFDDKNDLFSSSETLKEISEWRAQGKSVLYLTTTERLHAIFCIADPLRDGIERFLQQADQLGIKRKIILSGDHQQSVDAIAKQLGITEAHGEFSPHQKLGWVRGLQQQSSHKIMMLGDGINDAPTLAVSDISLTFSDATDLAKNNSDFILLGKDFTHLGKALQLMRSTRNIILQNLGWAIAYNVIAIPLAVMGLITPWMAAIGMSVSSLIVVLNSLRLRSTDKIKPELSKNIDNKKYKREKNRGGVL